MDKHKPTILIVDDVKFNARLLEKHLSVDYECICALNGKEALKQVSAKRTDLILLDILMPDMDGFEVCRRLKSDEKTMHIPIIFTTSLTEDEDETKGLKLGAVDYLTKPIRIPIALARIKNHLELKRMRDLLEQQACIDGLTGIPNRRRFDEILDREWARAIRNKTPLSLIMMDIDFFKKYNDNYGHKQGDTCLRKVGRCLAQSLQRGSDFIARYGGEEFAAILPDVDAEEAMSTAAYIRDKLAEQAIPHDFSEAGPLVSLSQGVTTFTPAINQPTGEIIEAADKALYRAKESGRNCAVLFVL
ncbi:diguanylate cyclase [Marinifilum sp. JC120]|nr:diguanylate cyclase [Marinifilum sp. JC120]